MIVSKYYKCLVLLQTKRRKRWTHISRVIVAKWRRYVNIEYVFVPLTSICTASSWCIFNVFIFYHDNKFYKFFGWTFWLAKIIYESMFINKSNTSDYKYYNHYIFINIIYCNFKFNTFTEAPMWNAIHFIHFMRINIFRTICYS